MKRINSNKGEGCLYNVPITRSLYKKQNATEIQQFKLQKKKKKDSLMPG